MEFDFAEVLLEVMERQASDLHLTAGSPPMIRLHGKLHALDYPRLTPQTTREVVYSILTNDQRQKLETDWQIDLAYSIPGRARFRVNAYFQRASLSAAFRLIPHEIPKIGSLDLPPVIEEFTKKPRGFVLVTGPTGSGKSTTLAAMLDPINDARQEPHPHHRGPDRVRPQAQALHRQPARGRRRPAELRDRRLKPALRQDPDVILVGEMRDLETIATAITAAETGHLVFATLHTQDTAPDRRPHRRRVPARAATAGPGAALGGPAGHHHPAAAAQGRRPGPHLACEILVRTPAVRNLIREGKTHQIYSALQTGGQFGMQTMDAALVQLVREHKITRELAESRSSAPDELRRLMGTVRVA